MALKHVFTKQQKIELEIAISHVSVMRMTIVKSLQWIKDNYGYDISQTYFSKIKKRLNDNVNARLYDIAKGGFLVQHDQRLKTLHTIEMELWKLYHQAWSDKDYKEAHAVINDIAYIQPYMAAFYESTKAVMEYHNNSMNIEKKTQSFDLESMGDSEIV